MGSRTGFTDGREEETPALPPKSAPRELAEVLLVCVLFIVFLRGFVFQQSEIPSGSMEDTILIGDYVIVNRFIYAPTTFEWERRLLPIREPGRGDIIVFKHPPEPERDFIKRIAALPGETVELRGGDLYIDGKRIEEPYVNELYRHVKHYGPVTVPEDHYFLLGDHRNRSADSRVWGPVSADLIKGRAILILFSTDAPGDPSRPVGQVTLRSVGRKLVDIVFRSRWDRALRPIR